MNKNKFLRGNLNALVTFFLIAGVCLAPAKASAQAQVPDKQIILMEQGTHKIMREGGGVKRVAVGDPAVADVNIINRRELLVTGKAVGITSLMVWPADGAGAAKEYRIKVGPIKDPLRVTKPDPELAQAAVDPGRSLEGKLPNLMAHRRARQAAGSGKEVQDRSNVELETQVMTEVKIAEVSRNSLQQFGIKLSGVANTGSGLLVSTPFGAVQNALSLTAGNTYNNGSASGILTLLARKGIARVLAEPSLVAMSGQTASYLAGGEFPVPVAQGGTSGGITIQYKEFGVRLTLSPTVLSRSRIALKVAPEVSDLDFSAGIQVGGVAVPALAVRRTETTVELGDGESFAISGLISSNLQNSVDKVPGLGDLPVIGAFFRSNNMQKTEKELIMIVTPHLVRPLARDAELPKLPGDKYKKYDPNFAETMLLESGEFNTGFSK